MATSTVWKENPYIIGRPIRDSEPFFGREELFQFIEDNLRHGVKAILLYGQRRIGKSSVLRQIPKAVHLENFVFVRFDLQDQARLPLARVLHNLGTEILEALAEHHLPCQSIQVPSVADLKEDLHSFDRVFLRQVYQVLDGQNLVLLLDEFDVLDDQAPEDAAIAHFFPYLRSILDHQPQLFIIPVIGRRLEELPKLFRQFTGAPYREIGLLIPRSATQLITKPAAGILHYPPDAIAAILDLSSGHPYFTQLLCHVLFARAREDQKTEITPADVDAVVEIAIESGEAGLAWFRDGLPIPERVVFSAIAQMQDFTYQSLRIGNLELNLESQDLRTLLQELGVVQIENFHQAALRLVEWGFLEEQFPAVNGNGTAPQFHTRAYRVKIELVRRWLVKRYPLQRELWELEYLEPQAQNLYAKADKAYELGNLEKAIDLYSQTLSLNPNHFHALFDLARTCWETHDFNQAVQLYARAYKVDPIGMRELYGQALISYSLELLHQGNFDLARDYLGRATALQPDQPRVQLLITAIRQEQVSREDLERVLHQLQAALHLSPAEVTILETASAAQKESAKAQYRRMAERFIDQGNISSVGRWVLSELQAQLELSAAEALEIEAEILRPYQEYQAKLRRYEQAFLEAVKQEYPLSDRTQAELQQLQALLGLSDPDVAQIHTRIPEVADTSLPTLLQELQKVIEAEPDLSSEDKTEALEQVAILDEVSKHPHCEELQKPAKTAIKILKGTASGLATYDPLSASFSHLLLAISHLLKL